MSHELLLGRTLNNPLTPVIHDAVHDLESFFWVLCWLTTKFSGPGVENPHFIEVRKFFEGPPPAIGAYKGLFIYEETNEFRDAELTNHVSKFFEPLKTTIHRLAELFKEWYTTRNFEGLHEKFLEVLDHAENECRRSNPPVYIICTLNREQVYKPLATFVLAEQTRRSEDLSPPSRCSTAASEGPVPKRRRH
jgi:hypothetical protein